MTTALFLLDTALDALMVLLAVRLAGERIRPGRVLLAALAGAAIAQAARCMALTRGQSAALWLPAAMVMMRIACGRRAAAHPLRHGALLLCAAGLLGGVVLSLLCATGSLKTAYALGGVCTLGIAGQALRVRRAGVSAGHARVTFGYRGRFAAFDAIIDSGNTLRDYLTHLPVIVIPEAVGRARFHLGEEPLRPIFADTAGGRQMMFVLTPQQTSIETHGQRRQVRALVALSPGMEASVPALVPSSLMEDEDEAEECQRQRGIRIWIR